MVMILAGQQRLKETLRTDMLGFVPCDKDQEWLRKIEFRRKEELRFREAIRTGCKAYDS